MITESFSPFSHFVFLSVFAPPPPPAEVSTVVGVHSAAAEQRARRGAGSMNAGAHSEGRLAGPAGLAIDAKDRLVIANEQGHTLVRVDPHRVGTRVRVWVFFVSFHCLFAA
jgi:hypothetical protein